MVSDELRKDSVKLDDLSTTEETIEEPEAVIATITEPVTAEVIEEAKNEADIDLVTEEPSQTEEAITEPASVQKSPALKCTFILYFGQL